MNGTFTERQLTKWFVALILSFTQVTAQAQDYKVETYRIQVRTNAQEQIKGTLSGVSESLLYITDKRYDIIKIPLVDVRKVRVSRNKPDSKSKIIWGAILGTLAAGYIANKGLQQTGPKSPILYGISLTLASAIGAVPGAALGKLVSISRLGQRSLVFYATGDPASVLRLQHLLEPLSETFQEDVINQTF